VDESVTAFISEMERAASARDLDGYMALFSLEEDVLFVYCGQIFVGTKAIAETHWDSWSRLTSLTFDLGPVLALQVAPDCAVVTMAGRSSRTYCSGESFEAELVVTLGLDRDKGGWKIRQKHESIPHRAVAASQPSRP
jgi:uncharacterized protein (TIGR02246 family)